MRLLGPLARAIARAAAGAPLLLAALLIGTVTLIAGLLFTIPTPYQVLLPGPATDVQQLIQPNPEPRRGRLYLTTIYSNPASVGEWLYAKINPEAGVVPREQARPKNVGEQTYQKLLGHMMDESKVAAKVVALRAAGYEVTITGQGAQVQEIAQTSRAQGVLSVGDIIVEADGAPVTTASDLIALIRAHRPEEAIRLRMKRGEEERELELTLGESPDEPGRARAGLVVLTHLYQYELPREIDFQTKDIGGASAGLMFALGVYNAVTPGDLTKGHKIAGTGSISTDGKVGPVGGVKYKVTAAEKAGAEVFLVPQENLDEAGKSVRKMRLASVATFKDALAVLDGLTEQGG